jgi:hypothetical protein
MRNVADSIRSASMGYTDWATIMTSSMSLMASVGFALSSLSSAWEQINDPDVSGW